MWQPEFVDRLSVSLDYYNIEVSDVIAAISPLTVVNRCFNQDGANPNFAANNFFNSTPAGGNNWYVTGQVKAPDRSLYIVDSVAGETINPDAAVNGPWDNPAVDGAATAVATNLEADFRYNGACLMLFLDGHSSAEAPWRDLGELQASRKIKVQNLTQN